MAAYIRENYLLIIRTFVLPSFKFPWIRIYSLTSYNSSAGLEHGLFDLLESYSTLTSCQQALLCLQIFFCWFHGNSQALLRKIVYCKQLRRELNVAEGHVFEEKQ